jgi:hypothetical protein
MSFNVPMRSFSLQSRGLRFTLEDFEQNHKYFKYFRREL